MLRQALSLLMGGVSGACGLAAVGLALYAQGPHALAAAHLFGAVGFLVGLACGGLHWALRGQPVQVPAALPPEALADLVRVTLAAAAAERQPRTGTAADRRPAAAPEPASEVATVPEPAGAAVAAATARPVVAARRFASSAFEA